MNSTENKIISELCEVIRQFKEGQRINYDFNQLPDSESEDLNTLKNELSVLSQQYNDNYKFVLDIAKGNLDVVPPARNNFVNPYKQLQSELLYLTWQIKQISEGDLSQRVSFSGDFSNAINKMVESLKEKQRIGDLNVTYVAELKELNVMKDRLLSIIAHDLKNPFSGLLMLSEILLTDIHEKHYENLEDYASMVKDFSDQGYKLLVNLLEWARSQTNAIQIFIEPLSLSSIVEEAKTTIVPAAQRKNITISCNCTHEYNVLADVNLLKTVMRNLLSNAVKFTNTNGAIEISGEQKDGVVIIHIKDNGVGIKPENISKLFRIDTKCNTKGTANEDGTGLGLILCKDFVEKMHGVLSVSSEWGVGTTFSFTLPNA